MNWEIELKILNKIVEGFAEMEFELKDIDRFEQVVRLKAEVLKWSREARREEKRGS